MLPAKRNVTRPTFYTFGGALFRPHYRRIGERLPVRCGRKTRLLALTSTLRDGKPKDCICKFLSLHAGKYHFIRRSNARPDIQLIFRNMRSGLKNINFPELNWVLTDGQKIIIFCALHSELHVTTRSVCRPSSRLVALVCWSLLLLPPYVCLSRLKLVCTGSGELWEGICMYTRRQRFWVIKGGVGVCGVP